MPVQFPFDFEKFLAALEFMAVKNVPELDKYKACKLLFLADRHHLLKYGRPIIGDRYCALPYGPIPSEALDLLNAFMRTETASPDPRIQGMMASLELDRRYQNPRISTKVSPAYQVLSKSDVMALDYVVGVFGAKGFDELKSLTHTMYAYRVAWERRESGPMQYEEFFEEAPDAIKGAREEMLENAEIRSAFPARDEL
jgi:Antitoxin SocA-like, Panacea domain